MADPDKKRKRRKDDLGKKKRKKSRKEPQAEQSQDARPSTPSVVQVTELCQPKMPPVVATSPGFPMPKTLSFKPLVRKTVRLHNGQKEKYQEVAMHSDNHPQLDYIARETGNKHQKHYIGICDPATGEMKVIEAKRMAVTNSVRAKEAPPEDMLPLEQKRDATKARNELLLAFGNKKARKMVEANTLNALPQAERDENGMLKRLDATSQAIVDISREKAATMATLEEINKRAEEARPVPKFNPDAQSVSDVYKPEDVIGPSVLEAVPVRDWSEAVEKEEEVSIPSKFVAHRLTRVCASGDMTMLRSLRFVYFLLRFFSTAVSGRQKGTLKILPRDKLREALAPASESVLEYIRRTFSRDGIIRSRQIDLLATTCCALACNIDHFRTDIADLETDLKMERLRLMSYFREIGATVKPVKDPKTKKTKTFAFLALPLQFPQPVRRKRR